MSGLQALVCIVAWGFIALMVAAGLQARTLAEHAALLTRMAETMERCQGGDREAPRPSRMMQGWGPGETHGLTELPTRLGRRTE